MTSSCIVSYDTATYDITDCENGKFVVNGYIVHNSDKINIQNLPKRNKEPVLRRSLCAPEGHYWVTADSSQIECRLLAFASGQQDLVQLFIDKRCPYTEMASSIYGMSYDDLYHIAKVEPTKEGKYMRNVGKEVVLGCGYGMSANKFGSLMQQRGLTEVVERAEEIVGLYRSKFGAIQQFWRTCHNMLAALTNGGKAYFGGTHGDLFYADGTSTFFGTTIPTVKLPSGTLLKYQNLRCVTEDGREQYIYDQFVGSRYRPKRIYGAALVENIIQAMAFDVLKYQALRIHESGFPLRLNVHDEWAGIYRADQVADAVKAFARCMREVPAYIPSGLLNCEVDIGKNYADLHTINV